MSQSFVEHCERENVSILPTAVEDLTAGTISRKEAWKNIKECNCGGGRGGQHTFTLTCRNQKADTAIEVSATR